MIISQKISPSFHEECRQQFYSEIELLRCYFFCLEVASEIKQNSNRVFRVHLNVYEDAIYPWFESQTQVMCVFWGFFFSFVRWKFQSPRWRWQCIAGPSGFRTACGLRECGLARFPFWVARRWGRTAADVLLSDCQYRKGTAPYGQCGVWNTGDSWGGCGLS